jgi:hypothetical protein
VEHIKAIETNYKGYKFRSRLEARWAVFFDTAEIAWEYEPEGYILSDGRKYLPDFYLPKENLYVEVKGVVPDDNVWDKLEKFSVEKNAPILLVCGIIGQPKFCCDIMLPKACGFVPCFIGVSPKNELIVLWGEGITSNEIAYDYIAKNYKERVMSATNSAVTAMKSARFEFL